MVTKKEAAVVDVRGFVISCAFMIKEMVSSNVRNLEMLKCFIVNPRFKQSLTVTEVRCLMPLPA